MRESSSTTWIGLRAHVVLRRDLGYVFLDDGTRLYRMDENAFDEVRADCISGRGHEVTDNNVSLFQWYASAKQAAESFEGRDI
jgi:hypothetical protein